MSSTRETQCTPQTPQVSRWRLTTTTSEKWTASLHSHRLGSPCAPAGFQPFSFPLGSVSSHLSFAFPFPFSSLPSLPSFCCTFTISCPFAFRWHCVFGSFLFLWFRRCLRFLCLLRWHCVFVFLLPRGSYKVS
jgi:hypothetical protein